MHAGAFPNGVSKERFSLPYPSDSVMLRQVTVALIPPIAEKCTTSNGYAYDRSGSGQCPLVVILLGLNDAFEIVRICSHPVPSPSSLISAVKDTNLPGF
jgi:hypothetical protein